MQELYEEICYFILETAERISIQTQEPVSIDIKIIDINENIFGVKYILPDEREINLKIHFPILKQEEHEFFDKLYNEFYTNTGLFLCISNLIRYDEGEENEILSFDTSHEKIEKIVQAYEKSFSLIYVNEK